MGSPPRATNMPSRHGGSCSDDSSYVVLDSDQSQDSDLSFEVLGDDEGRGETPQHELGASRDEVELATALSAPTSPLSHVAQPQSEEPKSWAARVAATCPSARITPAPCTIKTKTKAWKPKIRFVEVSRRREEVVKVGDTEDVDADGAYYAQKKSGAMNRKNGLRLRPDEQKRKDYSNMKREIQRRKQR
mmetsp:Transcript_3428/g.7257  ORF Transcript_3428/g.7257 Transcript_3428/m.7257 type:complete len:189 (+) Transcript_3428:26-592(+)